MKTKQATPPVARVFRLPEFILPPPHPSVKEIHPRGVIPNTYDQIFFCYGRITIVILVSAIADLVAQLCIRCCSNKQHLPHFEIQTMRNRVPKLSEDFPNSFSHTSR
jgi:hypothetical protein